MNYIKKNWLNLLVTLTTSAFMAWLIPMSGPYWFNVVGIFIVSLLIRPVVDFCIDAFVAHFKK